MSSVCKESFRKIWVVIDKLDIAEWQIMLVFGVFFLAVAISQGKKLLRPSLNRKDLLAAARKIPYLSTCSEIPVALFILARVQFLFDA